MEFCRKAEIMDEAAMSRAIKRIAHEIIERNKGTENLMLIGIQRRGVPLAQRIGALIVIERQTALNDIIETGTIINTDISAQMIGTIFYEGTPLHDGAVIVRGDRLYAAGCVLPLSNNLEMGKDMGTRHRACLGIAENSDAIAVVVSEETGIISMAKNGVLIRHFDRQTLYTRLVDEMIPKETASEKAAADGWRGKVKSLLNWMNQKEEDEQQ